MIKEDVGFLPISKLEAIADSLSTELLKSSKKPATHVNYQIELLEVFNYEIKRHDKIGYCDFELAYVCYSVTLRLLKECKKHESKEIQDFIKIIDSTVSKKKGKSEMVESHISQHPITVSKGTYSNVLDADPLLSRFNKLSATQEDLSLPSTTSESLETYKYTETISAPQLRKLLEDYKSNVSVLLIDFRTKKEYDYNHINYPHTVNIEPAIVNGLLGPGNQNEADKVTDQDLEERLRMLLPKEQYQIFSNRHKYDLIVLYNLRFGVAEKLINRFDALVSSLINESNNGNPCKSPFLKLVELLTYRNKYISSKLKRAPCYLSGGVRNSYMTTNASTKSSESLSSAKNGSPYLKNFGDYLGTAKSTGSTPISNSFAGKHSSDPSKIGYYAQSAPLKPDTSNFGATSNGIHTYNIPPPQQIPARKSSLSKTSSFSSDGYNTSSPAPPEKKTSVSPTKFLEQYTTGLTNLGNSCYMNCIIQCLGATPQLTKFFFPTLPSSSSSASTVQSYRQHININNKLGTKGILTTSFVTLLVDMFGNAGGNLSPSQFKKVIGSLSPGGQFANFDQQDCIEFLDFVLDSLHEDLNQMVISNPKEKQAIQELTPEQERTREYLPVRLASTIEWERYLKLNFSVIVDYFQGQYLSQLRCLECGTTSTTYNAFQILSLPIPERLNKGKDLTLDDCLQEFVQLELLDDENKWHCPNCKKFTRSTKKISITRLPQVLIIHFKRFKLSPTGYFSKMDDFIKYPVNDVLDLTSYWPHPGTVVNPNLSSSDVMAKDKEVQILATLPTRNQVPPFRYKLYGVANHYGNLTTGHYTAYVHKESDKKKTREWCYFDDSKVSFNQKQNQVLNKNAYCLFYQRI
ncbi:cysteine proteinase [Yamadazyma tenuis ATCC 10573]|uniref:Ubiquitin carboxyl-terminal hydrolase n=1 Tax=Candida tenuis (strain ATCC 10573 / BCRC 21748 / CBS 615 / JCM 9827 / NBRC 10315 / NRRL Y-1498 / VKM Y-70) TaxID=590646 RepID=G3BE66_CANTC|nr:cysteine proteinase [Yamadazyma tenuis ATCC 10573]EGV60469.1 cysteine proteinase [Yamadazyma tenuis ATCC 10573]